MFRIAIALAIAAATCVAAQSPAKYLKHGAYALPDPKATPGAADPRAVADVTGKPHMVARIERNVCAKDFRTGPIRAGIRNFAGLKKKACVAYGVAKCDKSVEGDQRAGAKNRYRMRSIPLVTDDAVWAMEGLIGRARELGSAAPSHFLFPQQIARTHYDPTLPISDSGFKKPWDAVRKAAGLPDLRMYDLRHTGITRMAEAGVPMSVAMTFAGHMTERMQRHYQAICMAAKRGWGEAVWSEVPRVSAVPPAGWQNVAAAGHNWPGAGPARAELVRTYQNGQHFHIRGIERAR